MEQQAEWVGELQEQVQRLEESVKDLKPQLGRTEASAKDLKQQVEILAANYKEIAEVCLIPPKDAVLHPEIRLPRLRKRFVLGDLRAEHFPTVEMPRRSNATHQPSDRPVQVGASRVRDRSGS